MLQTQKPFAPVVGKRMLAEQCEMETAKKRSQERAEARRRRKRTRKEGAVRDERGRERKRVRLAGGGEKGGALSRATTRPLWIL